LASSAPSKNSRSARSGYCSQEVLRAAEEARTAQAEGGARPQDAPAPPPFEPGEVRTYLEKNAHALEQAASAAAEKGQQVLEEDLKSSARALERVAACGDQELVGDLEEIENHLSVTEEKLGAALLRAAPEEAPVRALWRAAIELVLFVRTVRRPCSIVRCSHGSLVLGALAAGNGGLAMGRGQLTTD
jgi:hypothetical protein